MKTITQIISERIEKYQKISNEKYHDYQCDGLTAEYNAYQRAETELQILNLAKAKLNEQTATSNKRFNNTMAFLNRLDKETYSKEEVEDLIAKTINFQEE